jgi:hypothetical protein
VPYVQGGDGSQRHPGAVGVRVDTVSARRGGGGHQRREEIAPRLVRILEETVENASRRAQEPAYIATSMRCFLLAQFPDRRAYAPLIAPAGLRGKATDQLLGDSQCEDLPRALAAVCGGAGGAKPGSRLLRP